MIGKPDPTNVWELPRDTPLIDCIDLLNAHLSQKGLALLTPEDLELIANHEPCRIRTVCDLDGPHWSQLLTVLQHTSAPITTSCDTDLLRKTVYELSLYKYWGEN